MNEALEKAQVEPWKRVAAVQYSLNGNITIIAREGCSGNDLLPHADLLAPHIVPPGVTYTARPDITWYCVEIHGVPIRDLNGTPRSPESISEEIKFNWPLYGNFSKVALPRWKASLDTLYDTTKCLATIIVPFTKREDAEQLLTRKEIFLFNQRCSITAYEDRPPVRYCQKCWSIEHPRPSGCIGS